MKRRWIAAVLALVAVLGAAVAAAAFRTDPPVMTCGDFSLSNTELSYYYWSEYFYFSEAYGDYLADTVDFSQPLEDQPYDASRSWQDFLLEETLTTVRDTMSMFFQAEQTGFELPEDYLGTYRQVLVNFAAAAQEGGYADLEAYLRASYGRQADRESFERYLYHSHLAAAYSDRLLEDCRPSDEECRAYFADREAEYTELYGADPDDESSWLEQVRQDLQTEAYQNAFLTICSGYTFLVNEDAVKLTPPEGLYD